MSLEKRLVAAVREDGPYRLSNGGMSDFYIDAVWAISHPAALVSAAKALSTHAETVGVRCLAGVLTGGAPLAAAAAAWAPSSGLRMLLLRNMNEAEPEVLGETPPHNTKTLIVEDVITTGITVSNAVAEVTELGMDVAGVWCLVRRDPTLGQVAGVPVTALFEGDRLRHKAHGTKDQPDPRLDRRAR